MVRTKRHVRAIAEPIGVMTEAERKAVKEAQDRRVVRGDLDSMWRRQGKAFDQFYFILTALATGASASQHALFIIISSLTLISIYRYQSSHY